MTGFPTEFARQVAELYESDIQEQQARMDARNQLIAEARQHVLRPVYEGLGGVRRSTKRDAVEAAFPIAMEFHFAHAPLLRSNEYTERMYEHVGRKMRASWTWFLLWWLVRPAVWRLVVKLVEWLLKRETVI